MSLEPKRSDYDFEAVVCIYLPFWEAEDLSVSFDLNNAGLVSRWAAPFGDNLKSDKQWSDFDVGAEFNIRCAIQEHCDNIGVDEL